MNKAIIVLTGSPEAKVKFDEIAKRDYFVWNANSKNRLTKIDKDDLYWNGVKDKSYHEFIDEFLDLVNRYNQFENKYIGELIEKFTQDDCDQRIIKDVLGNEKVFDNFLLVIHGLTKTLTEELKDQEGIFQLHLGDKKNTIVENHDYVIFEDEENFEAEVLKVLKVLTKF
jgi:hypothetical protein